MKLDQRQIHRQLIMALVYDKKPLINDGYLVAHPEISKELTNANDSLIGKLLISGLASVFSCSSDVDLADGIGQRARGINTHQQIVASPSWPSTRERLDAIRYHLKTFAITWPADKNLGHAFCNRLTAISEAFRTDPAPQDQKDQAFATTFERVFQRFESAVCKRSFAAARSVWEEACWIEISGKTQCAQSLTNMTAEERQGLPGYAQVRRLMQFANQAYHCAYAAAAGHSLSQAKNHPFTDASMGVATGLSYVEPGMVAASPERQIDPKLWQQVNELAIVIHQSMKFKSFDPAINIWFKDSCRLARRDYLQSMQALISGTENYEVCRKARGEYVAELSNILGLMIDDKIIDLLGAIAGTPTSSAAGSVIPGTGSIFNFFSGVDKKKKRFVEKLMVRSARKKLDDSHIRSIQSGKPVALQDSRALFFGSLNPAATEKFLETVKPFRAGQD